MSDNSHSHELLAVVATFHHKAKGAYLENRSAHADSTAAYLSTNLSTMGICAFLNCFLA
jgi:hypothetical protein